jgi:hypothetical protein
MLVLHGIPAYDDSHIDMLSYMLPQTRFLLKNHWNIDLEMIHLTIMHDERLAMKMS